MEIEKPAGVSFAVNPANAVKEDWNRTLMNEGNIYTKLGTSVQQ